MVYIDHVTESFKATIENAVKISRPYERWAFQ